MLVFPPGLPILHSLAPGYLCQEAHLLLPASLWVISHLLLFLPNSPPPPAGPGPACFATAWFLSSLEAERLREQVQGPGTCIHVSMGPTQKTGSVDRSPDGEMGLAGCVPLSRWAELS